MFDPKIFQQDRTPPAPRDAPRPAADRPRFRKPVHRLPITQQKSKWGKREAYVAWCAAMGIRPLAGVPLAYGKCG